MLDISLKTQSHRVKENKTSVKGENNIQLCKYNGWNLSKVDTISAKIYVGFTAGLSASDYFRL